MYTHDTGYPFDYTFLDADGSALNLTNPAITAWGLRIEGPGGDLVHFRSDDASPAVAFKAGGTDGVVRFTCPGPSPFRAMGAGTFKCEGWIEKGDVDHPRWVRAATFPLDERIGGVKEPEP